MTATLPNGVVYKVEVDWAGTGTFVDITGDVVSVDIVRGRDRELDDFVAGRATVVLRNDDRKYDPENTGGAYYGNIVPLRKIRIQGTHSAALENMFAGVISDFVLDYERNDIGTVTFECVDDLDAFNDATLNDAFVYLPIFPPAQRYTHDVIDNAVGMMSTQAFGTTYTTSNSVIQQENFFEKYRSQGEYRAWPIAQKISQAEQGYFFCDRNGKVAFKGRYFVYDTTPAFTAYDTTAAAGGTSPVYQNLQVDYSSRYIYNRVTVLSPFTTDASNEATGGVYDAGRVAVDSTASIDSYGVRKLLLSNIPLASTNDPAGSGTGLEYKSGRVDLANWLLLKYKNPELRISSVDINLSDSTSVYTQIMTLDIGDTVNIARTFSSGTPSSLTNTVAVEMIEHIITPEQHIARLHFGSTVNRVWFTLDSTAFGLLDGDGLLAW